MTNSIVSDKKIIEIYDFDFKNSVSKYIQSTKQIIEKYFNSHHHISTEIIKSIKLDFINFFENEAQKLEQYIDHQTGVKKYRKNIIERLNILLKNHFNESKNENVSIEILENILKNAANNSLYTLDSLKLDADRESRIRYNSKPDIRPQVFHINDGTINIIRKAPKFEVISLRGGGTKGLGYSSSIDQFSKAGMLDGLKYYIGSSAGALTATCLSCNMSPLHFQNDMSGRLLSPNAASMLFKGTHVDSLFSGSPRMIDIYPDLSLSWDGLAQSFDSLLALDEATSNGIKKYLNKNWNHQRFQVKLDKLIANETKNGKDLNYIHSRFKILREEQDFTKSRNGKMVTFEDLDWMHKIEPKRFKNLILTGWDKKAGRVTYFCVKTFPHMPLAYAARVSKSFPVVFQSVNVNLPGTDQDIYTHMDGGVGNNLPMPDEVPGYHFETERILALTFDEDGKAYKIMHGPRPTREQPGYWEGLKNWVIDNFITNGNHAETGFQDKLDVYEAGPNVFPVPHPSVSTLGSDTTVLGVPIPGVAVSDETAHRINMASGKAAIEYIDQRQNQAMVENYPTLQEAARALTTEEKKAILAGGTNGLSGYDLQLYQLVRSAG